MVVITAISYRETFCVPEKATSGRSGGYLKKKKTDHSLCVESFIEAPEEGYLGKKMEEKGFYDASRRTREGSSEAEGGYSSKNKKHH